MRIINLYSFHKGINADRFDYGNTVQIINDLNKKYKVIHHDLIGDRSFIFNGEPITHGSILIFEFEDTKEFKIFEFGDYPEITTKLCKHEKFSGASIGQYNKKYWDDILGDSKIRSKVVPSIYPDSHWQFGIVNYQQVKEYRDSIILDDRLYWRGSIYKDDSNLRYYNVREAIEILPAIMGTDFYFGNYAIPFNSYIQETINFKLSLCFGGGGGYCCGDFCFRDFDLYGIGIPTIRPKYATETKNPLIPDVHYVAVDCEFDEEFRYKNPNKVAHDIKAKYAEVIHDTRFLAEISKNAHQWYVDNLGSNNITNIILKSIEL
jgi:hypothetical protein